MKNAARVLQVFGNLDRNGAETMVMNLYRHIDRNKIQFDFVANASEREYDYEPEIRNYGGRIFYVPAIKIASLFEYYETWKRLLSEHPEWRIIHCHHTTAAIIIIILARRKGLHTITHSHGTNSEKSIKRLINFPVKYISGDLFACSRSAAAWLFGNKAKLATILPNAIDVHAFSYNEEIRNRTRAELGLVDKLVVGHIGRFSPIKNYPLLLDVFKEIKLIHNNSLLLQIGNGKDNNEFCNMIHERELDDFVILPGVRTDVNRLIQAMDVFVFPSLYEGLGIVLIEAQTSGLPCLASDRVPREARVTDLLEFMSLDEPSEKWAEKAIQMVKDKARVDRSNEVASAGYDIAQTAPWMQDYYLARHQENLGNQP